MAEDCCENEGCGCSVTSIYTTSECPVCGRRLRITGDIQRIKLRLACPECGYHSHELSIEEVRKIID